jgi:hypothetical protein
VNGPGADEPRVDEPRSIARRRCGPRAGAGCQCASFVANTAAWVRLSSPSFDSMLDT